MLKKFSVKLDVIRALLKDELLQINFAGRSAEFCWVPEPFLLAREENHACMISSYLVNIEAQS